MDCIPIHYAKLVVKQGRKAMGLIKNEIARLQEL